MMKRADLDQIIEPVVSALGFEFLGSEFIPGRRASLLRVYIDAPGRHVALLDCEAVSRQLSAVLDVEDPIAGAFNLEVSSPGFDRPLFTPAHFARFAGRAAKIQTNLPIGGRRRFQGPILAVDAEHVLVQQDGVEVRIAHTNIQRANLVPDYSAYDATPKAGTRGGRAPRGALALGKAGLNPRREVTQDKSSGRRGSITGRKR